MSNVKVYVDKKAMAQLRSSAEVVDLLREKADRLRNVCGEGYETDTKYVNGLAPRTVASVYTETPKAMMDNSKNNTLLKAVEGMRE